MNKEIISEVVSEACLDLAKLYKRKTRQAQEDTKMPHLPPFVCPCDVFVRVAVGQVNKRLYRRGVDLRPQMPPSIKPLVQNMIKTAGFKRLSTPDGVEYYVTDMDALTEDDVPSDSVVDMFLNDVVSALPDRVEVKEE